MKQITLLYTLGSPALVRSEYTVARSVDSNDVFDGYVSYSIEFASFPDFAGNNSHPNTFSDTLLDNIAHISGRKPYIRVGGNTQDYALYDASLPYALNGTINPARSQDYPTTVTIGPSYFESYRTWKDVKFYHGFNLGLGGNSSRGWQTLLDTVPLACKALSDGRLYVWGYGNEPDLYSISAQGPVRPPDWDEAAYVSQWHNGTRQIKALLEEHCPELAGEDSYGYMAPSFAGVGNPPLKAPAAWAAGLNDDKNVKLFSTHNGATSPGVTLQGTLMNHAVTKRSVDAHVTEYNAILAQAAGPVPPLIFGETNSLYNQGRPGLSNTFGAALWGLDFNLYAASVGFKRVHMHMGTNYRYAAWQPLPTSLTSMGTKAPYYGSIAVAASLGRRPATVLEIPLSSSQTPDAADLQPESAYAIYTAAHLSRITILNMRSHNTTLDGAGLTPLPDTTPRNEVEYTFRLEGIEQGRSLLVRRLLANGSDAITGITWDGWSYNYELDGGRPVRLGNVTVGERVVVGEGGVVRVRVADASAAVVEVAEGRGGDGDGEGEGQKRGKGRRGWWFQ
ncbi:hypothetical protein C8A01DRAFT_14699 [Parachaetomium inaequale]|uniref:Beta-glucuronidase C-terminal domain-containing protein n=1 Tax=Parachaetomium inaequale TaxID=2588326 RepID=A0AAN6STH7_9PEZI|nr:hypothetical protein C8A01DRAFT_14699 [Parachaetomium inaequale]